MILKTICKKNFDFKKKKNVFHHDFFSFLVADGATHVVKNALVLILINVCLVYRRVNIRIFNKRRVLRRVRQDFTFHQKTKFVVRVLKLV